MNTSCSSCERPALFEGPFPLCLSCIPRLGRAIGLMSHRDRKTYWKLHFHGRRRAASSDQEVLDLELQGTAARLAQIPISQRIAGLGFLAGGLLRRGESKMGVQVASVFLSSLCNQSLLRL